MYFEKESTRSHSLDNLLWKRLWTFCKTGYTMNVEANGCVLT